MPRKFVYGPGLPGYGTRGVDGSAGLTGVATWFSSYDGASDTVTIKSKIIANKELFSNDDLIPGYPTRTYQDGDIFIDRNARIYQIDFAETNLYKDTGVFLNTSGFFTSGPAQLLGPGFQRYSNQFETEKYLIDTVYTNSVGDYTTYPTSIYDNAPLYYGNVEYIGSDVEPDFTNYYPFQVWTVPGATGGSNEFNSIALVREKNQNAWHFGNKDGVTLRDASLHLDFKDIYSGGTYHGAIDGTITTTNIQIPGWLNVGLDVSIGGNLYLNSGSNKTISVGTNAAAGYDLTLRSGAGVSGVGGDLILETGGGTSQGGIFLDSDAIATQTLDSDMVLHFGTSSPTGNVRLKKGQLPVQSYSSGATNRMITGSGTNGLIAEEYLEFSTYLSFSGGTHYVDEILFKNGDLASWKHDGNIKKENRTNYGVGENEYLSLLGSRAVDNANTGLATNADNGGWVVCQPERGGSTLGAGDGGNGGVFQVAGFGGTQNRAGDSRSGQAGLGGALLMAAGNGGSTDGTSGYPGGGGYVYIQAGEGGHIQNAASTRDASDGGYIKILGASGGDSNSSNAASYAGTGSEIVISAGGGGVNSSSSTRNGEGGPIDINGGNASGSAFAGKVYINGGNASGSGAGGLITISGGASSSGAGGNIILNPGSGSPNGGIYLFDVPTSVATTGRFGLQIDGVGLVTAGNTGTSDIRFKDIDASLSNVMSSISQLTGIKFHYNDLAKELIGADTSTAEFGLIAQEVAPLFPEIVNGFERDGSIFYDIDYLKFVPIFVEAFKEQQIEIHSLTNDVSTLTNENITLTNDVSTLLYIVDNLLTRVEALEASIG